MRTALEIFEEELSGEPLTQESVIEAIKIAQLDAIEETIKLCTESAQVEIYYLDDDRDNPCLRVEESSILNCAEILKKEIK